MLPYILMVFTVWKQQVQVSSPEACFISKIEQFELPIDCKTVRIFAYSSTREQSNKRSLAPRLTDFFTDFAKKTRLFCSLNFRVFTVRDTKIGSELHTKLYKGAWNVSANNAETVGHKDLRFGKIVYILIFFNISLYWLLPLDGFQFILFLPCLLRVSEKRKIRSAE